MTSLLASDYADLTVVVVDNGSVDGTSEALEERFGDSIVLLRNQTNLGFAGGSNTGIRWALERRCAFVCLVNNDAVVDPTFVSSMVRSALADPTIGALGCRNLQMENPDKLWGAYGLLTYGPFVVRMAGQGADDGPLWQGQRDVDWIIGNGSLWSCAAIEDVGLLDEAYFAYHDDVDWCVRFHEGGYRVLYDGTIAILHRGGGTSDARQEHVFPLPYFLARNGILFTRKHGSPLQRVRYTLWSTAAMLLRWVRALCSRIPGFPERDRNGHRYWDWEVSYARGLRDGLLGRSSEDPF